MLSPQWNSFSYFQRCDAYLYSMTQYKFMQVQIYNGKNILIKMFKTIIMDKPRICGDQKVL